MLSERQQQMVALFEKHVGAELAGDLDTTMATMSVDPHLNHVPTMAGGVGPGTVCVPSIVIIWSVGSFRRM
jgi:carboxymethylenebutenolidase